MLAELTEQSMVVAAQDQVSCDLSGEVAILQLKAGMYYGLDQVGARIWNLLQQPIRVGTIRDIISSEYDVTPLQCGVDLMELLHELLEKGLIEVSLASAS